MLRGGEMTTVEVRHRPREHGQSKYGVHNRLWVGIVDMLGVRWLQRRFVAPKYHELSPPDRGPSASGSS